MNFYIISDFKQFNCTGSFLIDESDVLVNDKVHQKWLLNGKPIKFFLESSCLPPPLQDSCLRGRVIYIDNLHLKKIQKIEKKNHSPEKTLTILTALFNHCSKDYLTSIEIVKYYLKNFSKTTDSELLNSSLETLKEYKIDLNKLIPVDSNNIPALHFRVTIYRKLNRDEEALPDLNQIITHDSKDIVALKTRAEIYLQKSKGFENKALQDLNQILKKEPENIWALNARAACLARLNTNKDEVDHELRQILSIESNNILDLRIQINTCFLLHDFEKIIEYSAKILAIDPYNVDALKNCTKAYHLLNEKRQNDNGSLLNEELDMNSDLVKRQESHTQSIKTKELFLAGINRILAIDPNHIWALRKRAISYIKSDNYTLAGNDLNQILTLDPLNIWALNNQVEIQIKSGNYEIALNHLNKILEIQPNNISALKNRAKIYTQLESYENALKDLKGLSSIDSQINQIEIYIKLNNRSEAINNLKIILNVEPNNIYALRTLKTLGYNMQSAFPIKSAGVPPTASSLLGKRSVDLINLQEVPAKKINLG